MGKRKKGKRKPADDVDVVLASSAQKLNDSVSFEQGMYAYRSGLGVGSNPYSEEAEPTEFNKWLDGWASEATIASVGC